MPRNLLAALGIRVVPIEDFEYRSVFVPDGSVLLVRHNLTTAEIDAAASNALGRLAT